MMKVKNDFSEKFIHHVFKLNFFFKTNFQRSLHLIFPRLTGKTMKNLFKDFRLQTYIKKKYYTFLVIFFSFWTLLLSFHIVHSYLSKYTCFCETVLRWLGEKNYRAYKICKYNNKQKYNYKKKKQNGLLDIVCCADLYDDLLFNMVKNMNQFNNN